MIAPEFTVIYKPHKNIIIDNSKLQIQIVVFKAFNLVDKFILIKELYIIHNPIIILKIEPIVELKNMVIIPIMQATKP